jgi:NAD(P)H-hydrate epimerase
MREVDRLMVEKYSIQVCQMMENAGRNLAELVRGELGGSVVGKKILIAARKGNNGGGGMAAARNLYNWGADIYLGIPEGPLKSDPLRQLGILENLPVKIKRGREALDQATKSKADLVVDSLIGYGISGDPYGWVGEMIKGVNNLSCPVISLDVPSGLDSTDGKIHNPCIRATATMTLALPKTGLLVNGVRGVTGTLFLADISVPDVLYREIGVEPDKIFSESTLVNIDRPIGGNLSERN